MLQVTGGAAPGNRRGKRKGSRGREKRRGKEAGERGGGKRRGSGGREQWGQGVCDLPRVVPVHDLPELREVPPLHTGGRRTQGAQGAPPGGCT